MGILGNMKAGFLKALEKAAAIVSMTGKQVGVDASAVAQVLSSQIEQQPYIYVGRGKGVRNKPTANLVQQLLNEQLRKLVTVNVTRRLNNHEQSL